MAILTKDQLREYWNQYINTNGSQAITGQKMNVGGIDIIDSMALGTDVANSMNWQNQWTPGTYLLNDVVRDGSYLMIANKETDDRPAPQTVGEPIWIYETTPGWAANNYTGTVWSGVRVTPNADTLWNVSGIRLWITDVSADVRYRLAIVDNVSGTTYYGAIFNGDVLNEPGWYSVSFKSAYLTDSDDYTFYVVSYNAAATTQFNYPWQWVGTSNQEDDPGTGAVEANNGQDVLRVNYNDDNGTSRLTDLNTVILGTVISVVQSGTPGNYYRYTVTGINDGGTYKYYNVSLDDVGGGGPDINAVCDVNFEVPVAASTDYVLAADYFLNNDNLQGALAFDTGAPTATNDGYGIDLLFQQYDASDDWDLMALSGDSGGSSVWVPYYVFDKTTAQTITAVEPTYQNLCTLPYNIASGDTTYEFKLSVTFTYDNITRSAYFRFSVNNGATWNEFRMEPKDITDSRAMYYAFPKAYTVEESNTFLLEAAKEDAADAMVVNFADVMVERVK